MTGHSLADNGSAGEFLTSCIDKTRMCFQSMERSAPALDATLAQHFRTVGAAAEEAPVEQANFSTCRCGNMLDLRCLRAPGGGGGGGGAGGGEMPRGGRGRSRGRSRGRGRRGGSAPAVAGRRAPRLRARGRGVCEGGVSRTETETFSRMPGLPHLALCAFEAVADTPPFRALVPHLPFPSFDSSKHRHRKGTPPVSVLLQPRATRFTP